MHIKYILIIFTVFLSLNCDIDDDKYFFQLFPSKDKDKPYQFHAYVEQSKFITINSTDGENCTIIAKEDINESVKKGLSSVYLYKDSIIIKTCFNPDPMVNYSIVYLG